ncbi:MAG: adenosylcobinamide-phosphate synthase CbiB [Pyrinomonadaceae bacterium]
MISVSVFVLAYTLDWLVGDPAWLPHPVRWMGRMTKYCERLLRHVARTSTRELMAGLLLTLVVVSVFGAGSWGLLRWIGGRSQGVLFIVSVYLAMTTLATRSLLNEALAVQRCLVNGDLKSARVQVGRIVGRDTMKLDESEVARATIETLAESASDGIVAPMLYLAIGGVPAALTYKAINTLDSMIGHRDKQYEFLGKFAARLDDVANFIPARLTAILIVFVSRTLHLDWRSAWRILFRDGWKHKSPNAGHPEAAMAGALGVRLGGTNYYDGEPNYGTYIGEARNPLDSRALRNAVSVTIGVSLLMFVLTVGSRLLISRSTGL